jgi:hypothetical protein
MLGSRTHELILTSEVERDSRYAEGCTTARFKLSGEITGTAEVGKT